MQKNEQDTSQELFDAIITGMKEWRASHPRATMREIEIEARERVSRLEAHVIEESALLGQANEWAGKQPEERPRWVTCGEALVARGKQKRRRQATRGRAVQVERTYGTCPKCGAGFFPPRRGMRAAARELDALAAGIPGASGALGLLSQGRQAAQEAPGRARE